MTITQRMSVDYPEMRVELDINDVAELFKRQMLVITMETNRISTITLDIQDVPIPIDVMFRDTGVELSTMIYISEDAFCDLLKAGSAKYFISDGECINAGSAFAYNATKNNLLVILNISKRGI